ncbi:MAG: Macrolide-specific ABC-type efflux carrier [Myxococcales bacterium]|nr:Macrolide-specific ABC-type efflux carrier [Myxococcales bacterium]
MFFEYLNIARKVLIGHKFRSMLTVLSITIGAFSIVLMSSLAQSGSTTLFRSIEELGGGRIIMIGPKEVEREEGKASSYTRGMTLQDRDLLYSNVPHLVQKTMFSRTGRKDIIADNGKLSRTDGIFVDGNFFESMKLQAEKGRFFNDDENLRHQKLCVVGYKTAKELWDGDAVGHTMQIGALRCRVVGQATNHEFWGMRFGFDWLDFVAVPLETMADTDVKVRPAARLQLKTDGPESNDIVKRVANAILSERHHNVDDYQIFDFSRVMERFTGVFGIMQTIVSFIAGIALLVGGVGVMNMMLVSVSERVREIGIRKAIGANPNDIGRQFLLEAILLAAVGGGIGVGAGIGMSVVASTVIRHFKPTWVTVVAHEAAIVAMAVSAGVGLFFGYFPARRAAKLDAITAIRGN